MENSMMIDGIKVSSKIVDLKTGFVRDFEPSMCHEIARSILEQMTPEEIRALPDAPKGTKATIGVAITPSGKKSVFDINDSDCIIPSTA